MMKYLLKTSLVSFQLLNKVEEGTYGVVYRAIERKTREVVALKRLKMEKEKVCRRRTIRQKNDNTSSVAKKRI